VSSEGTSEPQNWAMEITFYEVVHRTVRNIPEYKSKQANKIKFYTALACRLLLCGKLQQSG
jgi:hypothetical protein